jgi:hypothetical protein
MEAILCIISGFWVFEGELLRKNKICFNIFYLDVKNSYE